MELHHSATIIIAEVIHLLIYPAKQDCCRKLVMAFEGHRDEIVEQLQQANDCADDV